MKVAIEARALVSKGSGVRTYVQELINNLPAGHQYEIIDTERVPLPHELLIAPWLNFAVGHVLDHIKPDVAHFTKAAVPWRKKYSTVVTIYDLIPILLPESQKTMARWYWPGTLRRAARTSDHILTISEASKKDIIDNFEVDPGKITVTPLAVDLGHFTSPPALSLEKERGLRPYVLFVGTREPRKNVPLLVRAFARIVDQIPHDLLIAGRVYKGSEDVEREIMKAGLEDRVKLPGFVDYKELPGLYAGADLLVWPCVYEGWGLPPMEAMATGTPVIVSDGGSLPEVVGEAGEVVKFATNDLSKRKQDVDFEERLADKMVEVLQDKAKLERMRAAGLVQVRKFSWAEVAKKTVEVYERVAG